MGTTGRGVLRPWDPIFLRKAKRGALNATPGNTPPGPSAVTGTGSPVQTNQVAAGSGTVAIGVTGTGAPAQADQVATGSGNAGFSPASISGLSGWWDASDAATITLSGSDVTAWADKSGNGRTLSQATSGDRPSSGIVTQNGHNVIDFDGTEFIEGATASDWTFIHNGSDAAIFVVFSAGASSDPNALYALLGNSAIASANRGFALFWDDRVASSRNETMTVAVYRGVGGSLAAGTLAADGVAPPQTALVVGVRIDANDGTTANRSDLRVGSGTMYTNDPTFNGTPSASAPTFVLQAGAAGNDAFPLIGWIAEIIVYNAALSDPQMTDVRNYLDAKWGL